MTFWLCCVVSVRSSTYSPDSSMANILVSGFCSIARLELLTSVLIIPVAYSSALLFPCDKTNAIVKGLSSTE